MDFLFDIGNVIVDVDFIPSLQRLIPENIEDAEHRLDTLLNRKDEFEAGRIGPDEYFPWAANTLGLEDSIDDFMGAWVDIFTPNKAMWKSIEELSNEGHRLILFSNINDPHKQHLLEKYPVFQHFTGGIFSYQTGYIKPEPEIYQTVIQQYQLDPAKTAYIDDLPANISAGQRAGFSCHLYDSERHDMFLKWLDSIL